MRIIKNQLSKFLLIALSLLLILGITGCDDNTGPVEIEMDLSAPTITSNEEVILSVIVTGAEDDSYFLSFSDESLIKVDDNKIITIAKDVNADKEVLITAIANADKTVSVSKILTVKAKIVPQPPKEIAVAISGRSEVKSGQSLKLEASIEGTEDSDVTWEIKTGGEFAQIDENGKLDANVVVGDKVIEVIARSKEDNKAFASKIITIVAKPDLTQEMIDQLNSDKISFEGYININLYTISLFKKLYRTFTVVVKTAMDGTYWYAEYENSAVGTKSGLYYKKYDNIASQVGLSFMNDEEYLPMTDDSGKPITWENSGFYNNFVGLRVEDFEFNEETWRYEYKGNDEKLAERMVASANPYEFVPNEDGFALIIEEGEILGIYSKSMSDYTIVENYEAIQELIVAVNYGDDVEVPVIAKYSTEEIHEDLNIAVNNMRALDSYSLKFKEFTSTIYTTGFSQSGFDQVITNEDCYFRPFTFSYDGKGDEVYKYNNDATFGYQKINDNLYNSYTKTEDGSYRAARAYNNDFKNAKPSFAFAPEIFRTYYIDEEEGTTTYYVDDLMTGVATTFYHHLSNDINLYGVFALRGYTSSTSSFTPYVVVKDEYIIEAGFYYYLGPISGVVELEYSNFNNSSLPDDVVIDFETRYVPTSWEELTIIAREEMSPTGEEEEVNALDYLKVFFNNEEIANTMPFFGNPLGDTYGFGLTTIRIPYSSTSGKQTILFYYDVPLDIDYTINSSITAVEEYLVDLGYTKNRYGEYSKDGIFVHVTDSSLDLMIYVWKA